MPLTYLVYIISLESNVSYTTLQSYLSSKSLITDLSIYSPQLYTLKVFFPIPAEIDQPTDINKHPAKITLTTLLFNNLSVALGKTRGIIVPNTTTINTTTKIIVANA